MAPYMLHLHYIEPPFFAAVRGGADMMRRVCAFTPYSDAMPHHFATANARDDSAQRDERAIIAC